MRSNCVSSSAAVLKGVCLSIAWSDASRCANESGASAVVSRSSCVPLAGHEVMGTLSSRQPFWRLNVVESSATLRMPSTLEKTSVLAERRAIAVLAPMPSGSVRRART